MGRILCFDYGSKRVGVAMTDELKIIASPYETISPSEVIPFIKSFKEKNKVEKIVVGLPYDLKGNVYGSAPNLDYAKEFCTFY